MIMINTALDAMTGVAPVPVEKSHLLDGRQGCTVTRCEAPALITLGQSPFCLKHFLVRCYEWLDYLEPQVQRRTLIQTDMRSAQLMVEECSNRALLISLRCDDLSNLDRSRLLDILLLSSDLLFQLRVPRNQFSTLLSQRAKLRTGKLRFELPSVKSATSVG